MHQTWSDLQLVKALIDGGGLSGASRLLGVHHATILRRLDALESKSGTILFERHARGYLPTAVALEIGERLGSASSQLDEAFMLLQGADLRVGGKVRMATSDFLAQSLAPPALVKLGQSHPDIDVELG